MKLTQKQCLLITLLYADIFDYPLTRQEVACWCVFQEVKTTFLLPQVAHKQENFIFTSGHISLIALRQKRHMLAKEKWHVAKQASRLLRWVPSIEFIGVTGGLAMENAKQNDDIDFLFIVVPGTIWISRLLAIVTMEIVGMRRRRKAQNVKNAICLNMFMTSDALSLPSSERDLYTAHEVLQMRPLWERGGVYQEFLQENKWVKNFLPTAWKEKLRFMNYDLRIMNNKYFLFACSIARYIEPLARAVQLWYMKKHRTNEIVSDTLLRFHPHDARGWIQVALAKRLARYNLPLDKIFYGR